MQESLIPDLLRDAIHKHSRSLTKAEERALGLRAWAGDREAVELLVLYNLRWAHKVVMPWAKGHNAHLYDDLMAEALSGLVRAAEMFDPDRARFTTYAKLWMKQKIMRWLKHCSRVIRVPCYSDAQIDISMLGISGDESFDFSFPPAKDDPEAEAVKRRGRADLDRCIDELLSEREAKFIRLRYGWDGTFRTFREVGQLAGSSRARAEQIISRAIKRLRNSFRARQLAGDPYE